MTDEVVNRPHTSRIPFVAALLAGSVLLSRALGYLREAVIAYRLGVGGETDAYTAAFQIPDMLNYFLAGGALSIALIPMYTQTRSERGDEAAMALFAKVLGTMGVVAVAATALLWWRAEWLVALQYPRFAPETRELTTRLTRIVLPAQIFFVLGGIVRAALMANDRFASQALSPLLYNTGIIAGGLVLGARYGAEGFAWGALAGALVGPFLAAVVEARRAGLRLAARFAPFDREFRAYLLMAAPLMLGLSLLTVDEWYDRWFGGLRDEGTISQLRFARMLMLAPVAVVGQAIATAALPAFSRLWADGRRAELDRALLDTLRIGLGLALLSAAAFIALAGPIVELMYQRGEFTAGDAERVARLLRIFALAVPAWVLQQIAVRAFFARGDTWRPMLLGTVVALAAVPLYLSLGRRHGADGIAAAGVLAMSANALLTLLLARALHGAPALASLLASLLRTLPVAALAGVAGIWLGARAPGDLALTELAAGGAGFAAVALIGVFALGDAPVRNALTSILRRLKGS